mmetsp:Transcript_7584/g.14793  ORF Transcript_7584/g.14793 Transcript_7584/m.14793 type:complete len:267 (+) Transcript_7584:1294-2094(+)
MESKDEVHLREEDDEVAHVEGHKTCQEDLLAQRDASGDNPDNGLYEQTYGDDVDVVAQQNRALLPRGLGSLLALESIHQLHGLPPDEEHGRRHHCREQGENDRAGDLRGVAEEEQVQGERDEDEDHDRAGRYPEDHDVLLEHVRRQLVRSGVVVDGPPLVERHDVASPHHRVRDGEQEEDNADAHGAHAVILVHVREEEAERYAEERLDHVAHALDEVVVVQDPVVLFSGLLSQSPVRGIASQDEPQRVENGQPHVRPPDVLLVVF